MELNINNVNKLPVRTFRWLGVNELNLQEGIPEIGPYANSPVTLLHTNDFDLNKEIISDDLMETGMGEEIVEFVEKNKNSDINIVIPNGKKMNTPVILNYQLDEVNKALADRNFIYAKEESEVTIVLHYEGEGNDTVFHGGLTYLKAEKKAVINLIIIQMLPDMSINFHDIGICQEELSEINIVTVELGSKSSSNGILADLKGKDSSLNIQTIYFGDKDRSLDFNYIARHKGIRSESNMDIHGALLDSSKKTFRGTIDFKKGAKAAKGSEGEYTLLFNKGIKNISAPLILCEEEDVSGSHAANSGRIDENQLFYMMSRGLDELTAKKTMIEAWFSPAIDKIPSEEIKEQVMSYVKGRLTHVKSL